MITKRITVCALVILILAVLSAPGAVKADPVAEAKELQDAGDVTGAYGLLEKAGSNLRAELSRNKSELKKQVSALSQVSSQEKMDEIKKKNDALLAERKGLNDQLKKVEAAMMEMASLLEYAPYREKDTAEGYRDFLAKYPDSPFAEEAAVRMYDLQFNPYKEGGTAADYQEFIAKYPDSPYLEEAQKLLDEAIYNDYKAQGTAQAMQDFLAQFPDSTWAAEAEVLLVQLQYQPYKEQ
ncbi:MAG: hypothetical protein JSV70_04835, partial [bacterium]